MIESKLEDLDPIASLVACAVDAGLMRAIAKIRLPKAPRLRSVAGNGLPERMRTTAFAFLGLTAAAGLALVAIFAQLSFHVLTPAPLPDEPANGGAVAEAVSLHQVTVRVPAVTQRRVAPAAVGDERGGRGATGGHGGSDASEIPAPAAPAPGEGGLAPESANESTPIPASTSAPAPSSASPQEGPTSTSEPAPSPAPKPAPIPARPASPTPPTPPAPGNSQSGAAATHASDRGVEASSKSTASVEPPPPVASSSSPATEDTAPGNGNGKALGHAK